MGIVACGISNPKADSHEREVGYPAESAVYVYDRVLQTPEPEQSARYSVEKGGLVVRI